MNWIALFCISSMVLGLVLAILNGRALKQREDLNNEASFFKVRLIFHTVFLCLWCLSLKFLLLGTIGVLSLLMADHPVIGSTLTWIAMASYPLCVLIAYLALWRGLVKGAPYEQLAAYMKLPSKGFIPIILLWAGVFFAWHLLH